MIKYTKDHEWIRVDGDVGDGRHHRCMRRGQLGDVVFVEVPEVGRKVAAHEACAVVESVKAASDVYSPVSGEVIAANADLATNSALVNEDAEGKGWFFKVKLAEQDRAGRADGQGRLRQILREA